MFVEEYEQFIMIKVNFNIAKENNEEYLYDEDNSYLESNIPDIIT